MTHAAPLHLESVGGALEGWCTPGRGRRIFGGATLGQAMRAADIAIGGSRSIDALHAIFVGPGDADRPVRYRTRVVKRGRSLDVVGVDAMQNDRVILSAHVTFHDRATGPEYEGPAPTVPAHDEVIEAVREGDADPRPAHAHFEIRPVPDEPGAPTQHTWIRQRGESAGSNTDAAMLAYGIDFLITRPAHGPLDPAVVSSLGSSLDHAMWFHRPVQAGNWYLVAAECTIVSGWRSVCRGRIYDSSMRLVASAEQEALLERA